MYSDLNIIIERKEDLYEWFSKGIKPKNKWKIGTEHEKFLFDNNTLKPISYSGKNGINIILNAFIDHYGWSPVFEDGKLIALNNLSHQSITLEPGGQLELSGAPLETIHDTFNETNNYHSQLKYICKLLGIGCLFKGFHPKSLLVDFSRMPKKRYQFMEKHMPTVGSNGLDMMFRTATVQVNLDFDSEEDMVKKYRVSLALQPIATAIFANSPFVEGVPSGYLSTRSFAWSNTDPSRTGSPKFVFEEGMGFERYAEWALDIPMYFLFRDGIAVDVAGQTFRDFLNGNLMALPGELPLLSDWEVHISTIFPEVRLKRFLEMRGSDVINASDISSLPAFWVGLLYDSKSLDTAWNIIKNWTFEERDQLTKDVMLNALSAPLPKNIPGAKVSDLALTLLNLSKEGLERRKQINDKGFDETIYLQFVKNILDSSCTLAEQDLNLYENKWNKLVEPLFNIKF